jgi:hypothetical protein
MYNNYYDNKVVAGLATLKLKAIEYFINHYTAQRASPTEVLIV